MSDGDVSSQVAWLLILATVALVVLLAAWWVFAVVVLLGAVLSWLWKRRKVGPNEFGAGWADSHRSGTTHPSESALWPSLWLVGLRCKRSSAGTIRLFQAWASCVFLPGSSRWRGFPGMQSPKGRRAYPLVAIAGPLPVGSGAGRLDPRPGGQNIQPLYDHWLAVGIGRLGRTLVPSSRWSRVGIHGLPAPGAIEGGKTLVPSHEPLSNDVPGRLRRRWSERLAELHRTSMGTG
ncbi:MAG: hypothetical protein ACRENX_12765 [Candidatus Dormibacteria bacterium]